MAVKSFEQNMDRLEEIVSKMESGDLTLDDALTYYEEGIKLSRACYSKLSDAEKKIEKLLKKRTAEESAEFETRNMDLFNETES
jgi:exodeoxyribonuclease VII small subunit